jgi:hypothetical protein
VVDLGEVLNGCDNSHAWILHADLVGRRERRSARRSKTIQIVA